MTEGKPEIDRLNQRVRAARGAALTCAGWRQEAALRMLMNCVDPDVMDRAGELVVYGTTVTAVRDWEAFHAIVAILHKLDDDHTLLVWSGKPCGALRTSSEAPRVVLVDRQSTSLAMSGAMLDPSARRDTCFAANYAQYLEPPGTWMYAGPQSALPALDEMFAAAADKYFAGTLDGRLVIAGGMGALGGAQALAAGLNAAAFLGIDADSEQIKRRVKTGYCDVMVNDLDEALRILKNAVRKREAASVGLVGNCAAIIPELARRGVLPDVLTDLTPADSDPTAPSGGYVPAGLTRAAAADLLKADPDGYRQRTMDSVVAHAEGILALQRLGAVTLDCGNHIAEVAGEYGMRDKSGPATVSGVPPIAAHEVCNALASPTHGIVTFTALSGEPADISKLDGLLLEILRDDRENQRAYRWIERGKKRVRFQGLPARVVRLPHDALPALATRVNTGVQRGEFRAPMLIGASLPPAVRLRGPLPRLNDWLQSWRVRRVNRPRSRAMSAVGQWSRSF